MGGERAHKEKYKCKNERKEMEQLKNVIKKTERNGKEKNKCVGGMGRVHWGVL